MMDAPNFGWFLPRVALREFVLEQLVRRTVPPATVPFWLFALSGSMARVPLPGEVIESEGDAAAQRATFDEQLGEVIDDNDIVENHAVVVVAATPNGTALNQRALETHEQRERSALYYEHGDARPTPLSPLSASPRSPRRVSFRDGSESAATSRVTRDSRKSARDSDSEEDCGLTERQRLMQETERALQHLEQLKCQLTPQVSPQAAPMPSCAMTDSLELDPVQPLHFHIHHLPTEVLRHAVDHYIAISHHYGLRLVCRRWNAMVVSNCVLWMRRVPCYLTHGYTSTTSCMIYSNTQPSTTSFARFPSRPSFGNLTVATSTMSESAALLTRENSWSSDQPPRYARPQHITYCFKGCAYRTWRALKLQKALSSIRRFHKQKHKYYGGDAAFDVLFPPQASLGTGVCAFFAAALLATFVNLWSEDWPQYQTPPRAVYVFVPLALAAFFGGVVFASYLGRSDVAPRIVGVLAGICAVTTIALEVTMKLWPSRKDMLTFRVMDTATSDVAPPLSEADTQWVTTAVISSSQTSATQRLVDNDHLLFFIPIFAAAVGAVVSSIYHSQDVLRYTEQAMEDFKDLDEYCGDVTTVRKLPRRKHSISQPNSPTRSFRIPTDVENDERQNGDNGTDVPPSVGSPRGSDAVTVVPDDDAAVVKSYAIAPFVAYQSLRVLIGVLICIAAVLAALELSGYTHGLFGPYVATFPAVARVNTSGSASPAVLVDNATTTAGRFAVALVDGDPASRYPARLACGFYTGTRVSPVVAALAMCLVLARHAIGVVSSWRKVGRRLAPFTASMVSFSIFIVLLTASLVAFASESRDVGAAVEARPNAALLFAWAELETSTTADATNSSVMVQRRESQIHVTCLQATRISRTLSVLVTLTLLSFVVAVMINVGHAKDRYYDFKIIKYRSYFEKVCMGEDVTTVGIGKLLLAARECKHLTRREDSANVKE